jgi:predicted CoA-binding protein
MAFIESDSARALLLRATRTIAVVGLSDKPGRDSYRVARYLQAQGYTIIPVNPTVESVLDQRSYPDLASIGKPVDMVNVFRRPEFMPAIVEAAIAARARAVWMQFDTAHAGAAAVAASAGLDVVIDRCIMVEHRRLCA